MGTGKISNNNNNKNTGTKLQNLKNERLADRSYGQILENLTSFFTLESKDMSSYYERDSYKEERDEVESSFVNEIMNGIRYR